MTAQAHAPRLHAVRSHLQSTQQLPWSNCKLLAKLLCKWLATTTTTAAFRSCTCVHNTQVDVVDLDGGRKRERQPQLHRSLSTLAC